MKKIKEPMQRCNFHPQHTHFIHQSQLIFFYGASEYILGRLAGHALNVSMDSGSGFCALFFLLLLLFLLVALGLGTAGHTALHQRPRHRRGQRFHYSDGVSDDGSDSSDGVWIDTW
ncbi:hypothetical protein [Parascardovia denticolens]|uniref:hypothetical protein n=1 Tax=Parascardovia denticolens TaxID=78258 RepID=UPI0012FD510F|nr:hypothetical protein [Parascardovia denticolens]